MPASTYPDLIISYPPAQRLQGSRSLKGGRSLGGRLPPPPATPAAMATPAVEVEVRRSASAPSLLPALREKGKTTTADPARSLRQHPIQCGFPPVTKTCYSDLELPVAMAQDPKWSVDLRAANVRLGAMFKMNDVATAGFMPVPAPVHIHDGMRKIYKKS
mmetsp:Transcript_18808/g.48826  ORF Transcript_18808/g.48826 Transcript_18808/m.48826 type:complete len:160 (-) Transcript_18808:110-589(-)